MLNLSIKRIIGWKLSLLLLWLSFSCENKPAPNTLFRLVSPKSSSVTFVNHLKEDEKFNIIEYLYFYNGGGVAIGDINNDGLPDIYFSSNQGSNKLYLNKGDLQFEDITSKAGVEGKGNWKTGITMVDVNSDGYLDIYLCGVGNYKAYDGYNQLLINNGDLTFSEQAKVYGLDFKGFSTQSAFFDYDLDGDLDMYLLNHSVHSQQTLSKIATRLKKDSLSGDRLYKNEHTETGKAFFREVTQEAGILSSSLGYGLGLGVSDMNNDGYPDIYVSNDFNENDYLYINQRNGTFLMQTKNSLSHTSRFSMGNDIADFNNDLWPDVFTCDMLPRDESVIKTSAGEDSYEVYEFKLKYGFGKQVSRNSLQLNRGPLDSGRLILKDVAMAAGVEATDWSWSPLLADFNGDGQKDIFITNGIVKRPNDLDYINFISNDSMQMSMNETVLPAIERMPSGKVSNFIFSNRGDLTFEDQTKNWGLKIPSLSNGSAYGDLDNDGDLDLVVNNIDTVAFVYQNTSQDVKTKFLSIKLNGDPQSKNNRGIGSKVIVYADSKVQLQELQPTRGWCSSSDYKLIFGLGENSKYDSVKVIWPDGNYSVVIYQGSTDLIIPYSKSKDKYHYNELKSKPLVKKTDLIDFVHKENDFNAFNYESLIPHMLSTQGPRMTVGDVNGDQLQDVFIGGAKGQAGSLYIQSKDGSFHQTNETLFEGDLQSEDSDAAMIDVEQDGDLDLVVVSGGQETQDKSFLVPRLYINDGKGRFRKSNSFLTNYYTNASCIEPADYDKDGDMDFFIGSDVIPLLYGMSPTSVLFGNNGKGSFSPVPTWLGQSQFDNMTRVRPGMVKDALWADINKDSWLDLVLVGEWMPITILIQQPDHSFLNQSNQYGISGTEGWWNRIEANDFDKDGDIDFVVGNLGLNSRIKVSKEKPLRMYLGDFDSNGGSDHILVYYNGENSYPFVSRDQLIKQIPSLKKKFLHYYDYRNVLLPDIVTPQQIGNSAEMRANIFASVYLKNEKTHFEVIPLPIEAQLFPVYAILADDVNSDGFTDIMLGGNLNATQPDFGPYDTGLGLVLLGDGTGHWSKLTPMQSGFVVPGEAREIKTVLNSNGQKNYLISRNNDRVLGFNLTSKK